MESISFPNMFTSSSTSTIVDKEATFQNLSLLLKTACNEYVFDPQCGTNLKGLLFEQNDYILKDIIIDGLYEAILTYIPQITVLREDITVNQDTMGELYATIKATYKADYTTNMYTVQLTGSNQD